MLGAHLEAEQPADTGHPEDQQAGTDPEKTAEPSREDSRAEEWLRLQQQVSQLHQQLRRQEARWSATLRHLQAQIDALRRRDGGPWGGRGAAAPRGPGAGRTPAASLLLRTKSDTLASKSTSGTISSLSADGEKTPRCASRKSRSAPIAGQGLSPESAPSSQPIRIKVERIDSGKIVTHDDGDKTVSISLRVRGTASAGRGRRPEEEPTPLEGKKAAALPARSPPTPSRGKSARPAAYRVPLTEHGPAAQDDDTSPLPSEGPEGESLAPAQTDGPPEDTEPQLSRSSKKDRSSLAVAREGSGERTRCSRRCPVSSWGECTNAWRARTPVDEAAGAGREVTAPSGGTRKDAGTKTAVPRFFNGDVRKILPDERVIHPYAGPRTMRSPHPRGPEVVQLPDKRTEKVYPDGSKETLFPDGTVKRLSDGCEETVFPDGTSVRVERNGDRTIVFSNGQRDIHTAQFKRREYPDGTVKTVYCSGRQETLYASGRVRVRDEPGRVVLGQKQVIRHTQ